MTGRESGSDGRLPIQMLCSLTSIPGANAQADLDQGNVIVTTTRILFVGPMYTKEWEF